MDWFSKPIQLSSEWRCRIAWSMLFISLIFWPITQLTVGATEPPIIFGLSWFAITITAMDILVSTHASVSAEATVEADKAKAKVEVDGDDTTAES